MQNQVQSARGYKAKVGRYIGDLVYGANDGIITSFAIVAGVAGASLEVNIVIILGVANLLADGFSMASSNYLARKSEKEYTATQNASSNNESNTERKPIKSAIATFIAFVLAGAVPLLPYILKMENVFLYAIIATSLALFSVGSLRARIIGTRFWVAGIEMLAVGSFAALVAYLIGYFLERII